MVFASQILEQTQNKGQQREKSNNNTTKMHMHSHLIKYTMELAGHV